jgi:para-nitrobenzyl esterase
VTTVSTTFGQLRGSQEAGLHVFRGIPFAQPPVGPLRFRAPESPTPWQGVRDATAFAPSALQAQTPISASLAMEVAETSEDCLYLNVWTPGTTGRRPVMVWIHGGAFVIGSGSQDLYNGAHLASRGDAVVVTINYRLGIFGFLHGRTLCGNALETSGNEGILDQVAALEWVRDEIASFGGDPGNVTVFGESAGSASIATLLGIPQARGLFQKAILESGSANLLAPPTAASVIMQTVLDTAGLTTDTAGRLRDLPAQELLDLQVKATPRNGAGLSYGPVIDGQVVPRSPFEAVADGETRGVSMLIGTTLDEMKLFAFLDPGVFQVDEAGLQARVRAMAGDAAPGIIEAYRAARGACGEPVTPFELYEAIVTDNSMRVPSMRLAALQSGHTPATYAYLFTRKSPSAGGMLGACHALDLPFVWGTYGLDAMKVFAGEGPEVAALSGRIQDAWLAFARTGNPGHEGLPAWPAYEPGRRATMILDDTCRVEDAPREPERRAWEATDRE